MTIPPVGIPDGPPPPAPVPGAAIREYGSAPPPSSSELLLPQTMPPRSNRSQYPVVPPDRGAIRGAPQYPNQPRVVPAKPPADQPFVPGESKSAYPNGPGSAILDFAPVKDGVSTGSRPELDGLDWLKSRGYKTVVYLRRPGDDDTTDRRQVERRDMRFVSLEVSPDTLIQSWVDDFNRTVGETAARPIFVYARDPAVTGTVWYLHLRTAEFLTHDEARVRAARLGLRDESSELYRAAVKLLSPNL
jgi:protein tyrosine phosphatase (PTP) superfamily phosphohydrolase (DUF442 family)